MLIRQGVELKARLATRALSDRARRVGELAEEPCFPPPCSLLRGLAPVLGTYGPAWAVLGREHGGREQLFEHSDTVAVRRPVSTARWTRSRASRASPTACPPVCLSSPRRAPPNAGLRVRCQISRTRSRPRSAPVAKRHSLAGPSPGSVPERRYSSVTRVMSMPWAIRNS